MVVFLVGLYSGEYSVWCWNKQIIIIQINVFNTYLIVFNVFNTDAPIPITDYSE